MADALALLEGIENVADAREALIAAVIDNPHDAERIVAYWQEHAHELAGLLEDDDDADSTDDAPITIEDRGPPPFPGAVFDETRHRWVRRDEGAVGGAPSGAPDASLDSLKSVADPVVAPVVQSKMAALLNGAAALPGTAIDKAVDFVSRTYAKLRAKYGKWGARFVLAGMVLLMPTPIPGSSLLPVALAEAIKRRFGGVAEGLEGDDGPDGTEPLPDGDALHALIIAALTDFEAHMVGEVLESVAAFDETKHPRDDKGQFVSRGELAAAKADPAKAAELRKRVTRPAERAKLAAHLGTRRTPPPKLSEKSARAKAAHKLVDKDIQRYAEEHNEPAFAKAMGGVSFPNGEPVDVAIPGADGRVAHGVELKTMVDNTNNKITMKRSAMERKAAWERKNKAPVHTVVFDDQEVFNANGPGEHDESKRVIYYRRGYGSFRVGTMHRCKDLAELKKLMAMDEKKLPAAAQRPAGQRLGKLAE